MEFIIEVSQEGASGDGLVSRTSGPLRRARRDDRAERRGGGRPCGSGDGGCSRGFFTTGGRGVGVRLGGRPRVKLPFGWGSSPSSGSIGRSPRIARGLVGVLGRWNVERNGGAGGRGVGVTIGDVLVTGR